MHGCVRVVRCPRVGEKGLKQKNWTPGLDKPVSWVMVLLLTRWLSSRPCQLVVFSTPCAKFTEQAWQCHYACPAPAISRRSHSSSLLPLTCRPPCAWTRSLSLCLHPSTASLPLASPPAMRLAGPVTRLTCSPHHHLSSRALSRPRHPPPPV
jgi:hypothetical protein